MDFSEKLVCLRTNREFTQEAVAHGAGISLRAYQNYEHRLREPKLTALIALANFYDITLDELVCRER